MADRAGRKLNKTIEACTKCPRLIAHCQKVAIEKRAAYHDETYWGKPVPNLGSTDARLLIVGLAPGAHGANRTGRMFTGDRSGDFLFKVMHAAGFASQPTATHRGDGLELIDCLITAPCHCAPPDNKPTTEELSRCAPYLDQTIDAMKNLKAIICLGGIAHRTLLRLGRARGWVKRMSDHAFNHGMQYDLSPGPIVFDAYHPSQQNTFTGRLTETMLQEVFDQARLQLT